MAITFLSGRVLQRPNASVLTPLAQKVGTLGTAEGDNQFSSSSAIGGSGNELLSHYKHAPAGLTLVDTQSARAEAIQSLRLQS